MKPVLALLAALTIAAQPAIAAQLTIVHGNMPVLGDQGGTPMPSGFVPAPIPNIDMYAPVAPFTGPAQPRLSPDIAPDQHPTVNPGSGWIPGSAFNDAQGARHPVNPLGITPTLSLKVPLD
ncbi:MAG TPA: hypothetical protein VGH36_08130 [Acetobacteraceae bacterium]|jgi:hypothetical protein